MSFQIPADQPYVPVITGGDLGAYSLAREFHEFDGTISAVVPTAVNRHFEGTKLAQVFPAGPMFDTEIVLKKLIDLADQVGGGRRPLLLIPGYDHLVRIAVQHRERLASVGYRLPDITMDQLDQAALKDRFYQLCDHLGVPYPLTVMFNAQQAAQADSLQTYVSTFVDQILDNAQLSFPLILKADDGGAWANITFSGRRKVHLVESGEVLHTLLIQAVQAGYRAGLVIQQFIPGPDHQLGILTQFRNRTGTTSLTGLGSVIVEDHAPGLEGNARAIVLGVDQEVAEQGQRLLDALNWHGFGMFDLKTDPRTGRTYFLEMNPRLGRHHYYMTAAGANPVRWLVEELLHDGATENPVVLDGPAASMTLPLKLAQRYATPDQAEQLRRARTAGTLARPWKYAQDRRFAHRLYLRYRDVASAQEVAHSVPGTS